MLRTTAAIIFLCLIASPAHSHTCEQIRAYVAEHGKAKAIAAALRHGATWEQILEASKCLKRQRF